MGPTHTKDSLRKLMSQLRKRSGSLVGVTVIDTYRGIHDSDNRTVVTVEVYRFGSEERCTDPRTYRRKKEDGGYKQDCCE